MCVSLSDLPLFIATGDNKAANPKATCALASSHLGHQLVNLQARPPACVCVLALSTLGHEMEANFAFSDIS